MLNRRVKILFTSNNGLYAFKLFLEIKPDIVITDIKMPHIDGIQLTKEIKKHSLNVFVIVITAYEDKETFCDFYNAGVDFYMIKPIVANKLSDVIDKFAKIIEIQSNDKC